MKTIDKCEKPSPKIAFFDIDGTLLPIGRRKPSEKTVYALSRLREQGVVLCMATGRSVLTMPKLEGISFDVFMVFNGSYCFDRHGDIFRCPIPQEDVFQILSNARKMNRAIVIGTDSYTVANGMDEDLKLYFSFGGIKVPVAENFEDRCRDEIYQIMLSCREEEYETILRDTMGTSIAAWWDRAVDIIPTASGKGVAVENVIRHYGFSPEEAIAFGDGGNDIEMFRSVGTGIAMGNAPDSVKAAADVVCGNVEEDGVYWYCAENRLI